jgi:hypothetical protein
MERRNRKSNPMYEKQNEDLRGFGVWDLKSPRLEVKVGNPMLYVSWKGKPKNRSAFLFLVGAVQIRCTK